MSLLMNHFEIVAPDNSDKDTVINQDILSPFSPVVLDFIVTFSNRILNGKDFKKFPELIALAFWLRKSNITKFGKRFKEGEKGYLSVGRGIIFHIAPSNVDSIFIYSWFISMLIGNINIIRITGRHSLQVDMLIKTINEISEISRFDDIKNRFMIIKYEHSDEITSYFSSLCDVRVIWGGDDTIEKIRKIPIKPNAKEITFADKFSFSVIKAEKFLLYKDKDALVENFFNDVYWFGQRACSSPRLVFWAGNKEIEDARSAFWKSLSKKIIREKDSSLIAPLMADSVAIDKLIAQYSLTIASNNALIENNEILLNRILLNDFNDIKRDLHCGGGLFYEFKVSDINEIAKFITQKDQTISVFGISKEEITEFILNNKPKGIDRVVPIGKSLEFSIFWDGYDLIKEFSRTIEII